jgi:hypothetical protein
LAQLREHHHNLSAGTTTSRQAFFPFVLSMGAAALIVLPPALLFLHGNLSDLAAAIFFAFPVLVRFSQEWAAGVPPPVFADSARFDLKRGQILTRSALGK